ncbi:MAG: cytochrome c-type biogenesis protein [Gaiellaceae bacterium]
MLLLALAAPAAASDRHPTQGELEGEVICPTCHTTIDQSDSPIAQRMKAFIAQRIAAGDTRTQIEDKLIATFGPSVIARPSMHGFDLLAWLLPIVGLLGGAAIVGAAAWRWSRTRGPAAAPPLPALDPELERRVDDALATFE